MGTSLVHPSTGERIRNEGMGISMTDSTLLAPDTVNWEAAANCLGINPDLFSPELGADAESARQVCLSCISRAACLGFAIEHGIDSGIWGGFDAVERALYGQEA